MLDYFRYSTELKAEDAEIADDLRVSHKCLLMSSATLNNFSDLKTFGVFSIASKRLMDVDTKYMVRSCIPR